MNISLDSDALFQLNTAEARALHDVSDGLSARGVGKIVNLPQIIVVGEQSSGKSSVLEAISRVRFPVEGGLCTRFATELVLRQARETRIDVSVRFADGSKPPKSFQRTGFQENDLAEIVKAAKECMGFNQAGKEFSKDVLRLEIEGPKMYPLTLVDLPGLFHSDTETQSLSGKRTVDQLVESYMRQKKSIVLVVITANNQLANHAALRKVKEFDPARERTIGVITKPDLTRPGYADERMYIRVAKNQEAANKLKLGWHVLRNRAEDEPSLEARDEIEAKFFQTGTWATIPREDLGVANLRKKLSKVLFEHIRQSLPEVVEDIETKLRERQEELDRLGKARSTLEDRRTFLLTIASEFQRLARDGIYGRYNDAFFGSLDDEDRKLRAQLRNLNRIFDHILSTKGSSQVIDPEDGPEDDGLPEYLEAFLEKYPYDFANPETITLVDLNAQLQRLAAANQGRELPGLPNKGLAVQLFQRQATPWRRIAQFHINQVTLVAKAFVDELFKHVIGPSDSSRATEAILSTCVDPFFSDKEELLQAKLEEILRPYTHGYALPLDAEFHRSLSKKTLERIADHVCCVLSDNCPDAFRSDSGRPKLTRPMITRAVTTEEDWEGGKFATEKVIDMALALYEMSRRTFTENVINLAIESCLICDIPKILTATQVNGMSAERLAELAAESDDAQPRRQHVLAEIEILRRGLTQCRRYRPRTVTALPSPQRGSLPSEKDDSKKGITVECPNPPHQRTSHPEIQAAPQLFSPKQSSKSTIIRDAMAKLPGATSSTASGGLFQTPASSSGSGFGSVLGSGLSGSASLGSGSTGIFDFNTSKVYQSASVPGNPSSQKGVSQSGPSTNNGRPKESATPGGLFSFASK